MAALPPISSLVKWGPDAVQKFENQDSSLPPYLLSPQKGVFRRLASYALWTDKNQTLTANEILTVIQTVKPNITIKQINDVLRGCRSFRKITKLKGQKAHWTFKNTAVATACIDSLFNEGYNSRGESDVQPITDILKLHDSGLTVTELVHGLQGSLEGIKRKNVTDCLIKNLCFRKVGDGAKAKWFVKSEEGDVVRK